MTERPPMQWFSGQLDDAFSYAHAVHGAQGRKSGAPAYIGHLLGVAALVVDDGGSEAEVIAALLHDAVEDAGGAFRLADIEHRYGSEVAYIVDVCSDTKTDPKPPWRERKTRGSRALWLALSGTRANPTRRTRPQRTGKS